jgi:predicted transcriptional regulator
MSDDGHSLLRMLVRLQAALLVNQVLKDGTNREKILYLNKLGVDSDDIAIILETTPGTVRKELSLLKAKGSRG